MTFKLSFILNYPNNLMNRKENSASTQRYIMAGKYCLSLSYESKSILLATMKEIKLIGIVLATLGLEFIVHSFHLTYHDQI